MKTIPTALSRVSLLLICFLFFHSPLQAKTTFPTSTILAPGDIIQLQVKSHPLLNDFNGRYTVNPQGVISLPGIGELKANGKSVSSLNKNIKKALRSVAATDSQAKTSLFKQLRFIILGNGVRYPGWYQVPLHPSIEELTAIGSGLIPGASTKNAKIIRKSSGKTKEIPYKKALPLHSFDKLVLDVQRDEAIVDNGDLLYVIIPREVTSEFSPTERNYFKEKVEVDRHGFIFLPSQGNIRIAGLTTGKISEMLTNNLPKYLSKSDKASVNLIEKRHYIQILGHVATPGWYNIPESANIQAILGQAGGTLEGADLARMTISRTEKNGSKRTLAADVEYYLSKGDNRMLPVLHQNDTVFVPLAPVIDTTEEGNGNIAAQNSAQSNIDMPKIRIFGAVNSPGIYPSPRGMNLLDLIITAQGEAADADLTQIKIMRADGGKEIFNMQALLDSTGSGEKTVFPMIKGGDIVHIARQEAHAVNAQTGQVMQAQTITMTGPGSNGRGLQSFTSPMTPLEAIAQAGGLNDFADTNDIVIIRRVDGKQKRFMYNYDKALEGTEPDVDFQLKAGDIIYIP